jgi:hypothetical protein
VRRASGPFLHACIVAQLYFDVTSRRRCMRFGERRGAMLARAAQGHCNRAIDSRTARSHRASSGTNVLRPQEFAALAVSTNLSPRELVAPDFVNPARRPRPRKDGFLVE